VVEMRLPVAAEAPAVRADAAAPHR